MATQLPLMSLCNPLVTVEQLSTSSSQLDGIPADLEASIRYKGALLTQAAGILLRLPQEVIAQAVVIFTRYFAGPEGGSFKDVDVKDVSAACVYFTAKLSFVPQSPRSVLNVFAYLLSTKSPFQSPNFMASLSTETDTEDGYLSEGQYQALKLSLFSNESLVLRNLSYTTRVMLPHHLALTYLQTLGVLPPTPTTISTALARRTLAHLNSALFSPQLLYLTHQPPALAVAAIYLAAREVQVRLVRTDWWEIFDVDKEDLGFLVVGMQSMSGWAEKEQQVWAERICPLTPQTIDEEIARRQEFIQRR